MGFFNKQFFSRNDVLKIRYEESSPPTQCWPKTTAFTLLSLKPDCTHSFEYVLHVLNYNAYQAIFVQVNLLGFAQVLCT
jgi:hypothetical protein